MWRSASCALSGAADRACSRAVATALLLGMLFPATSPAAQPPGARVLVVAPHEDDPRTTLVREAIAYWNDAFRELGLTPVLGDVEVVVASPDARALETYAHEIAHRAGRLAAGPLEPDPPPALLAMPADIVVLLSTRRLLPFAWPLPRTHRHFVAIDRGRASDSGRTLRVIAHELGHVLGLEHDLAGPDGLMCMPCRDAPAREDREPTPLPALDPRERARLLELYAAAPSAEPRQRSSGRGPRSSLGSR